MLRATPKRAAGFPLYGLAYLRAAGWVPPERWHHPVKPTRRRIDDALALPDPASQLILMPPQPRVVNAMAVGAERRGSWRLALGNANKQTGAIILRACVIASAHI